MVWEVCGGNRSGWMRDSRGGLWREQVGMDERWSGRSVEGTGRDG